MISRAWSARICALFAAAAASIFLASGCGRLKTAITGVAPLAPVSPLPLPKLPPWITSISPKGEVSTLAQVRVIFKNALIPVEAIESPDEQSKLQSFEIVPALPGHFRFLTPRMVGFQADKALPIATRVRITLKTGLADLSGNKLDRDIAWTFTTQPIKIDQLPGEASPDVEPSTGPTDIHPTLTGRSNAELDASSLQDHSALVSDKSNERVALKVELQPSPSPAPGSTSSEDQPQNLFDESSRIWIYTFAPRKDLDKATHYKLVISPGVLPARGNLPSGRSFSGHIDTYAPLAFQKVTPLDTPDQGGPRGRFVTGAPGLNFNNPLDGSTIQSNFSITPAIKDLQTLIQFTDGDDTIRLNPLLLDPDSSYTVVIGAGLKDKFGQLLSEKRTVTVNTGDVAADIWAPAGLNIFPAGTNLQLDISAVNLPDKRYRAAYQVLSPADLVYADSADPSEAGFNVLAPIAAWSSYSIAQPKNQTASVHVPLRQQIGGATGLLGYGITGRTYVTSNGWRAPTFYGFVQLTNLGIFAQWFPASGVVRVHHLSDGSPAGGAHIEIFVSKLNAGYRPAPTPCAAGTADAGGMLVLGAAQMAACMAGRSDTSQAPSLLAIARENNDWAYVRTDPWSGSYGYGIYADWPSATPPARGVVFSDRNLYQPGETAWLTVEAYYISGDSLVQDRGSRYAVTLESPDGAKSTVGAWTTNAYGTFSFKLPLKSNQAIGYYTVHAKAGSGAEMTGQFQVAQFKPPNFKVELTLDKQFATIGDAVTAKSQSSYLFGAPVQGGTGAYYVTRQQTAFAPAGLDDFTFGRQWYWPEEPPSVPSDVLQTTTTLGSDGSSTQAVKVASDLPYAMTYRVDMQTTDVSNLSVSDSKSFTALPSDNLIGLKSDWVADAGKPFKVQLIVADPSGKAVAGRRVHVELQEMKYSAATQIIEGGASQRNQIQYVAQDQTDTDSAAQPQTISLTPPKSGSYRIRANFSNAKDDVTATDTQIWASGPQPVNWGSQNPDQLQIKLDKSTYAPGDVATVLIQSPYQAAQLYLAIVRHDTIYRAVTRVSGGAPRITFKVTPDMAPNAAVEAVLVRQGPPLSRLQPGSLDSLSRVGFAPFSIDLHAKYLKLSIRPSSAKSQPGAMQTVRFGLQDASGRPARGQLTVIVANEAVLQLSGYRLPDLVKTVYAERSIETRFGDNRPSVVLAPIASPVQKGWGYGGGFLPGAAATRIRKNFQPLAYFNPALETDAAGVASATFKLPDDLTTWRVLVVATAASSAGAALRFGNADATFIATKPLVTNPILPQFARPGDLFDGGVSVLNDTGQQGTLSIDGTLTGVLRFVENHQNSNSKHVEGSAPGTTLQAYRFTMSADAAGSSQVRVVTRLGSATDAFEVPLVTEPFSVTESAVESGATADRATIPIDVAQGVANDTGGLDVSIASTLVADLNAPKFEQTAVWDLPLLEPSASAISIGASLKRLQARYGYGGADYAAAIDRATTAVATVARLQMPDGGLAPWPGARRSDAFVTPFAARALAQAESAGMRLDPSLRSRLVSYLESLLASGGGETWCLTSDCRNYLRLQALGALADFGERRADFLSDIYDARDHFDIVTQLQLAQLLSKTPGWQAQGDALSGKLQEAIYVTGRYATINYPEQWGWLASPTAARAEALALFTDRRADAAYLGKLAQSLLALRVKGTWATSYDNAEALGALVDYLDTQGQPPNFSALVQLGTATIAQAQFSGYRASAKAARVPMPRLPRGRSQVRLSKSGPGTLYYLVSFGYRMPGNRPGVLNGLRVTREIRPANKDDVIGAMGLAAPDKPLTLAAGQVWDIGIEVITDHPIDHVIITDPLPAGLEAVDASFQTNTKYFEARGDSWEIDYQTIYRDKVSAYANRLEAGAYEIHYLARSVTPGTFLWPGAQAQLEYAPEEFGRAASTTLQISQ